MFLLKFDANNPIPRKYISDVVILQRFCFPELSEYINTNSVCDTTNLHMGKLLILNNRAIGMYQIMNEEGYLLCNLCVNSEHRKKGYGKLLFNDALKECPSMRWKVLINRPEIQKFYANLGFFPQGKIIEADSSCVFYHYCSSSPSNL